MPAKSQCQKRSAFALIVSMIFVLVFSAFAVAMFSASGVNVQIANNHHKANVAFANAESGLEVMRFWLNRIEMPSSTPVTNYHETILSNFRADITNAYDADRFGFKLKFMFLSNCQKSGNDIFGDRISVRAWGRGKPDS